MKRVKSNVVKNNNVKTARKPVSTVNNLVVRMRKWLKTHTKAELAYKLGLQTTSAIDVWLRTGNVPVSRLKMVKDVLTGKSVVLK